MPPIITARQARELADRLAVPCAELLEIRAALAQVGIALADLGVVSRTSPPVVTAGDNREIAALKERAIALTRRKDALRRRLAREGAVVVDEETLEIALSDGSVDGSYLSWQPGEPVVAWWRAARDGHGERLALRIANGAVARPSLH